MVIPEWNAVCLWRNADVDGVESEGFHHGGDARDSLLFRKAEYAAADGVLTYVGFGAFFDFVDLFVGPFAVLGKEFVAGGVDRDAENLRTWEQDVHRIAVRDDGRIGERCKVKSRTDLALDDEDQTVGNRFLGMKDVHDDANHLVAPDLGGLMGNQDTLLTVRGSGELGDLAHLGHDVGGVGNLEFGRREMLVCDNPCGCKGKQYDDEESFFHAYSNLMVMCW